MCLLQGLVLNRGQERPARILIDSGSSHQYISSDFARRASLEVEHNSTKPHWVQVADGNYLEASSRANCTLIMGYYRTRIEARILDMPHYDIILGLDWLRTANPIINWQEMSIQVRDEGGDLCELFPRDTSHYITTRERTYAIEEIDPVTWSQAEKILRQPGSAACLFAIRDSTGTSNDTKNSEATRTPMNAETEQLNAFPRLLARGSKAIRKVVKGFADIFREELPPELPPTRDYEHTIDTGDAAPINLNAYPLSQAHLDEQTRQISQMQAQGLIQESSSPWGFPVLFVKKPEGKWRMCIDFRALNAVTRKNGYPLPRIQECLDLLGSSKVLSKIDLTQGYYQVRVDTRDREKTAFNTREGKFEYLAMPFGLANAPATFQTMMNRILRPLIVQKCAIVYLDDIVIFSASMDEHIRHLTQVFTILRTNKLYAKPSKCLLGLEELEFCGHIVGNGTLRPIRSKIQIILDWPVPTNVHEVRQFLGLATYYRRFIRSFAQICVPLFDLLKEGDAEKRKKKFRKISWTAACEQAFRRLKEYLTTEPVLLQPDTTRAFVIETDASEWAVGCVLLQLDTISNKLLPVAYDGRKLTPAEINYPVHEKELLAIKYAVATWRVYIDNNQQTIVYTDHESLKYLATMRKPTKRLARWIEEFGEYDLDLRYRKGALQVVPDALSRRPDLMGEGPRNLAAPVLLIRDMDEDEWATHMRDFLVEGVVPPEIVREDIYAHQASFAIANETLQHVDDQGIRSPYTPIAFRADFLERMHNDYGHLAFPGILGVVQGRGWWHSLVTDIKSFVQHCTNCQVAQRSRPGQETELPQTLTSSNLQIFDRWAIDLIGRLPETPYKNVWIVTAIEYLTGWPVAKALPNARAETIATFIHEEIAMVYGPPKELLSDNGTNLVGKVLKSYMEVLKVKHRVTTPYHPRTNGKVENFNGFLGATLTRMLVNQPIILWDQYLAQALFAVRVRIHTTSRESPYYLLFGRQPPLPSDANEIRPLQVTPTEWDEVLRRIEGMKHARIVANERLVARAIAAGKTRDERVKPRFIREGDWVLVRAEARHKFEGRWAGPYRVDKTMPLGTYRLTEPGGNVVRTLINGQRLIPANVNDETRKTLWNSKKIQRVMQQQNITIDQPSPEIQDLFQEADARTVDYDELAAISPKEWSKMMARSGDRSDQVGEGDSGVSPQEIVRLQAGLTKALQPDTMEESQQQVVTEPLSSEAERIEHEEARIQQVTDDLTREDQSRAVTQSVPDDVEDILFGDDEEPLASGHEAEEDPMQLDEEHQDEARTVQKRISAWERDQRAATQDREREVAAYGLRRRPNKRQVWE